VSSKLEPPSPTQSTEQPKPTFQREKDARTYRISTNKMWRRKKKIVATTYLLIGGLAKEFVQEVCN
jgi:hypothetical protein